MSKAAKSFELREFENRVFSLRMNAPDAWRIVDKRGKRGVYVRHLRTGIRLTELQLKVVFGDIHELRTKRDPNPAIGWRGPQVDVSLAMMLSEAIKVTCRVAIQPSQDRKRPLKKVAHIMTWGLAEDVDTYYDVGELPEWMQHKLAVLMILDPSKINNEIEGVGRRISENIFWLYPQKGEDLPNGDDSREEGEEAGEAHLG